MRLLLISFAPLSSVMTIVQTDHPDVLSEDPGLRHVMDGMIGFRESKFYAVLVYLSEFFVVFVMCDKIYLRLLIINESQHRAPVSRRCL